MMNRQDEDRKVDEALTAIEAWVIAALRVRQVDPDDARDIAHDVIVEVLKSRQRFLPYLLDYTENAKLFVTIGIRRWHSKLLREERRRLRERRVGMMHRMDGQDIPFQGDLFVNHPEWEFLDDRHRLILYLKAQDRTTAEIAQAVGMSQRGINKFLRSLGRDRPKD